MTKVTNNITSIITVNFNNYADTVEMVESIVNKVNVNYEIIIVDNASLNNEYELLFNKYKNEANIKVIKSSLNLGFAGGNSLGIKEAKG